jgi:OHCU decarboxylase
MAKWSIANINDLPVGEAVSRLGHLYEHSPWVVERAWSHRPFASVEHLHQALRDQVRMADLQEQLALIRAHPDLVGQAALRGSLTAASTAEQQAAGLGANDLSDEEKSRFASLNAAYQARFGFPFVICARENKKQAILDGFDQRLGNDSVVEIASALREIHRIAWYRLTDLVEDTP